MAARHWLAAGTCLLAAGAQAQDAAGGGAQAAAPELAEIVVTGTQLSRRRAIEDKQSDARVTDNLGTDELGQLPDKNVGEALNRLPGVTMLVEKGEGRYVQIRGINAALNNVTINGASMGSAEAEFGGRAAALDVVASSALSSVQVIKTPTPDMDGQGIGGTVNVNTALPFDRSEPLYGFLSGRAGYEDIRPESQAYGGDDPWQIDGLVSGKSDGGTFGWLLGGSYTSREYIAPGVYQDDWTEVQPGIWLPQNVKNNYYVIGRERTNLNGALQWQLDGSRYYLQAFYANYDEFQHRNRFEQSLSSGIVPSGPDAGTAGRDRVASNIRLEDTGKDMLSVAAGGENTFGRAVLGYAADYHHNTQSSPNDFWEFRSGRSFGPSHYRVDGDGVVHLTPDAGTPDRQDPALIGFRRVRFFEQEVTEDGYAGRLDLRWNQGEGLYYKAGLKVSRTERTLDESNDQYDPGVQPLTLGTSADFTRGAFTNHTPHGDVPNIWLDVGAMNAFFANPANAGYFAFNDASSFTSRHSADYDLTETIYAGYAMAALELGDVQLIGGARLEYTDIDSSGYLLGAGATAQRLDAGGSYTDVLPSLIANWHVAESVILRAAVTRSVGRPNYETIAPRSTVGEDGTIGTVSVGNPDVEARRSWNYDLAAEWYPNPLTVLSVGLFYKDLSDEIVTTTRSYTDPAAMQAALAQFGLQAAVDVTGLTRLDVELPTNDASSTIKGIDLLAQTQFGWLPRPFDGLGVSVSASFIDGDTKLADGGRIPLVGQAESSYAATLFYQSGRIDASVSYAYNDSYLTDPNDDPALRLDQGEFGRWDAKIAWALTQRLKLFVEGVNLNDEPTSEFQGGVDGRNTEFEYVGRTYYLGIAGSF